MPLPELAKDILWKVALPSNTSLMACLRGHQETPVRHRRFEATKNLNDQEPTGVRDWRPLSNAVHDQHAYWLQQPLCTSQVASHSDWNVAAKRCTWLIKLAALIGKQFSTLVANCTPIPARNRNESVAVLFRQCRRSGAQYDTRTADIMFTADSLAQLCGR